MVALTKGDIDFILVRLVRAIKENKGVIICMQQKRVNFENWIQIELCNILSRKIIGNNAVEVETKMPDGNKGYTDIKITNEKGVIQLLMEIKIIKMGKENKVINDIKKLKECKDYCKAVLCVAYKREGQKVEKSWNKYQSEIEGNIGQSEFIRTFYVPNENKREIEVILYFNQWE